MIAGLQSLPNFSKTDRDRLEKSAHENQIITMEFRVLRIAFWKSDSVCIELHYHLPIGFLGKIFYLTFSINQCDERDDEEAHGEKDGVGRSVSPLIECFPSPRKMEKCEVEAEVNPRRKEQTRSGKGAPAL